MHPRVHLALRGVHPPQKGSPGESKGGTSDECRVGAVVKQPAAASNMNNNRRPGSVMHEEQDLSVIDVDEEAIYIISSMLLKLQ